MKKAGAEMKVGSISPRGHLEKLTFEQGLEADRS